MSSLTRINKDFVHKKEKGLKIFLKSSLSQRVVKSDLYGLLRTSELTMTVVGYWCYLFLTSITDSPFYYLLSVT